MKIVDNRSCEWYTPRHILERVYYVMNIDLDPASPNPPTVKAKKFYTKKENGLLQPWNGNIYLNPPYGRDLPPWISKLLIEWHLSHVTNAILLVPAKVDTVWFNLIASKSACICTIRGRLHFIIEDKTADTSGTFSNILILLSKDPLIIERFKKAFCEIGLIWELVK